MYATILVIDDDVGTLDAAQSILESEGYNVLLGTTIQDAVRLATVERPSLVLLDMTLPEMNGEALASALRADDSTANIPIIIMLESHDLDHVTITNESACDGYLFKPFDASTLITTILPLIRMEPVKHAISTGNGELDSKMGGGIPLGSLTLIEGASGAGKSVLSQQMIWGSLSDRFKLTVFTSENSIKSLVKQMRSLSLDVLDFLLLGRLRILPMELAQLGKNAPDLLLQALRNETDRHLIVIDSLTLAISHSRPTEVLGFFEACNRICGDGIGVIIILHSHAVDNDLLVRLRSLCDAHLQLRTEEADQKLIKTLEVTKVRGAEKTTGNIVSFEVEPRWGMRVIPISKVRG